MATATPLLLCDLVFEDPVSHNHTPLGVFTDLRPSKYPTPRRLMSAYVLLIGEPGETGDLVIQCTDEQTGDELLYGIEPRRQIGRNGKLHVHIRFGEEFFFEHPGRYRFALSFDGVIVAEQTLTLREV